MKPQQMTVRELSNHSQFGVAYDDPKCLDRVIWFDGDGWYSMDDSYAYHKGVKPTFSRIKVFVRTK